MWSICHGVYLQHALTQNITAPLTVMFGLCALWKARKHRKPSPNAGDSDENRCDSSARTAHIFHENANQWEMETDLLLLLL